MSDTRDTHEPSDTVRRKHPQATVQGRWKPVAGNRHTRRQYRIYCASTGKYLTGWLSSEASAWARAKENL